MRNNLISLPLYLIVFATGAAGLIYQVAWQKYLSRLLGSDSMATAIILATFLGGLSFGYYLCGKFTLRVKNHFKAYALLEGIIGAWCICFPTAFSAVETFTRYWSFSPPLVIIVQGLFCSALLMGIPTICMGGTIPFLTRGISRNIAEATNVHAKVYAINTGGAFLGTLLAGFYLIPVYGMPLTIMGTALVNLAAFVFFYVISNSSAPAESPEHAEESLDRNPASQAAPGFPPLILYIIAFSSGFYVMTLENVLIRISNLSLGSSSYSFSMIVSVFVLSIAIGSYVVGRLKQMPGYLLFVNQFFITLLLLAIYISLDTWPYWAHVIRIAFQSNMVGFWGYYGYVFLALTFVLILPVGFMGATVPIAFHELKRDLKNVGKHSGILFSWNTLGNLTGSLIGGIAFYYFLNNAGVFLTAVLLAAVSTCLAGWYVSKKHFLAAVCLAVMIFAFTIFTPFYNENNFMIGTFRQRKPFNYSLSGPAKFFKKYFRNHKVKFYKDGPTATVAVVERITPHPRFNQKSMAITVNGKSDSATIGDIYTLKLCAHIPMLLAQKRKDIMVIGLGTGVTAGELTLYPDAERIDIAEISPAVVEALPYFHKSTHNVHKDPRVHIHIGDAFRILGRSHKKWDIITSEPSNPWVTGVDLLFTQEFYKLVRQRLTENGILVQWIQAYAASPAMLGMVVNTVRQEFPQCRVFRPNANDLLIIASNRDFSKEDLNRAEKILQTNAQVRTSLQIINMASLDSILLREIWPPAYISDSFSGFGIQTMDNPRLHYIAGKNFFTGEKIPFEYLSGSVTAAYSQDFLMLKKYKNWVDFTLTRESVNSLLISARDKVEGNTMPMSDSLKLKAYLANPGLFALPAKDRKELQVDLIPFIAGYPQAEKDWGKVGLKDAGFREKARPLLDHTKRFRSWIVPYPVDGLIALLQQGVLGGRDVYEKNWCSLQLALLLIRQRSDSSLIKEALDQTIRGDDGKIILEDQDRILLETINNLLSKPG